MKKAKQSKKTIRVIKIKPNENSPEEGTVGLVMVKRKAIVEKHRHNIRTILSHSNATPIGRYIGIGFQCCFCARQFAEPADLKTHTISQHEDAKSTFMEHKTIHNFIVKLDITNLKCDICQTNIDSLNELIDHFKTTHDLLYHPVKNHIVPFKFDSDLSKCILCGNGYSNFKVLLEHMHTHLRNYVCEVCDSGFVNKNAMLTHAYRHKTGEFQCSYCSKIFNNHIKKRDHEQAVHVLIGKRSKCGYCGEKFSDYTKKNNHEVKVHGAKAVVLKCQACDRSFDNQRSLSVHTKNYHLMSRVSKKQVSKH